MMMERNALETQKIKKCIFKPLVYRETLKFYPGMDSRRDEVEMRKSNWFPRSQPPEMDLIKARSLLLLHPLLPEKRKKKQKKTRSA